jgi:hypothetical protein
VLLDWSACEPSPGVLDEDAFARYRSELAASEPDPVVSLHRVTLPGWLGEDFWLELRSPDRFAEWAAVAADRLGDVCRRWVTVEQLNARAYRGWFTGTLPPRRRGRTGDTVRALGNLLTAHVLAAPVLGGEVALDVRDLPVYELSAMLVDVLEAPSSGVGRHELRAWLVEQRRAFYATRPRPSPFDRLLRAAVAGAVPLDQAFPRAVGEAYAGRSTLPQRTA